MENLANYVDLRDYCAKLSQITNVSIDDVKSIVFYVFGNISEGNLESYHGFLIIEDQLTKKMAEKKEEVLLSLAS